MDVKFLVEKLVNHIKNHPMMWREKPRNLDDPNDSASNDRCEALGVSIFWEDNNAAVHTAGDRHTIYRAEGAMEVNEALLGARAYRVAYVVEHGPEE